MCMNDKESEFEVPRWPAAPASLAIRALNGPVPEKSISPRKTEPLAQKQGQQVSSGRRYPVSSVYHCGKKLIQARPN